MLTVFNWTESEQTRTIQLAEVGMNDPSKYKITEVFGEDRCCKISEGTIALSQPAHSVRMFKLIKLGIPPATPTFSVHAVTEANAGENVAFALVDRSSEEPVLTCRWDFGDGTHQDGLKVQHTYTEVGKYTVRATATGLGKTSTFRTMILNISGNIATKFVPSEKKRPQ